MTQLSKIHTTLLYSSSKAGTHLKYKNTNTTWNIKNCDKTDLGE